MTGEELLSLCRDALREAGEAEVLVCARHRARGFARFAVGELGQHMDLDDPVVTVRVAHGRKVAEGATALLEKSAIVQTIRDAAARARFVPETEGFPGFTGADEDGAPLEGSLPPRFAPSTAGATADDRVERLLPVLEAIRGAGLVSAGVLETSATALAVATTRGCARSHDSTLATFKVWALETPGAGGAAGYGGHMHRDVAALDLDGETARAIRIAKMSRDPIALDAGSYDVVMEAPAVSELLEWLGAIAFGASEVEQGTSPVAGRAGALITGEAITLHEDPLDPSDLGVAAPFDREGTWRRRVPLILRGVAREVLYDRTYAARMGARSTGSAVFGDLGSAGGISASALSLEGGSAESVDELIGGMDRGLYICRLHYVNGLLEPRRAVMTGLTRDGCFLVEKGKITRAVGNMRFTDSFLEALARADGMTRMRQAIPTGWSDAGACVTPAVRMRQVRFNGKSQERPKLD